MTMTPFIPTDPIFENPLVSSEVKNNFNALFNGDLSPLRPRASDPLAMTIYINPSLIENFWLQVWQGLTVPLNFAGGNSPSISAPSVNPRIDLLTINSSGTLAWTTGAEAESPSAPSCPEEKIPICYIYCKTTMTKIVNFEDTGTYPNDGYIYRDVRPFLNLSVSQSITSAINFMSVKKVFAGDGSDGNAVISANTTLPDSGIGIKIMQYNNLTVNAGIYLEAHANDKIFVCLVKGTLTLNGTIRANGRGAGGAAGVGAYTVGAGGGPGSFGAGAGGAGEGGRNGGGGGGGGCYGVGGGNGGNAGATDQYRYGGYSRGKGGDGGGGDGGHGVKYMDAPISPLIFEFTKTLFGAGGGSGGNGSAGGLSGAGGRGGGVIWIEANTIIWGGAGLMSANGSDGEAGSGTGKAGGGGGGGGVIQVVYKSKTGTSTFQMAGGGGGVKGGPTDFGGGNGIVGLSGEFQTE